MFNKNSLNNFKESIALIFASVYASGIKYYNRINIKLDFICHSRQVFVFIRYGYIARKPWLNAVSFYRVTA